MFILAVPGCTSVTKWREATGRDGERPWMDRSMIIEPRPGWIIGSSTPTPEWEVRLREPISLGNGSVSSYKDQRQPISPEFFALLPSTGLGEDSFLPPREREFQATTA
jgi:hypothetical protein